MHISRDNSHCVSSPRNLCSFELETRAYTRHLARLAKATPRRDTPVGMRPMVVYPMTPSAPVIRTSGHARPMVPVSADTQQAHGRPRRFWESGTPCGRERRMGDMLPPVSNVNHGLRPQAPPFVPRVPPSVSRVLRPIDSPQKFRSLSHTPARRFEPAAKAQALLSLADIAMLFGLKEKRVKHTLNASLGQPEKLKFVLLNKSATRNWRQHQIIYAKTNLHLLPGFDLPYPDMEDEKLELEYDYDSDYSMTDLIDLRSRAVSRASMRVEVSSASSNTSTPPPSVGSDKSSSIETTTEANDFPPIALFAEVKSLDQKRAFRFLGTYELAEVEFFAPGTTDLMEMLNERAGSTTWKTGLSAEWAKIKLIKLIKSGSL
ncbi:hypothetical protein AUEXF2481DRAFT_45330 [Aureobasidium subglaciale EXF-2481]|uniref:Uncharacterized protein n=1 Tax=Aureobasidium subglaciale (strain EXF-2481) TaxID=1043005 RepID=A0A074Y2P8_AURSE|nr:uncharacterized protein AUEXF2481DRAFT_45330 [Aureobasidium subglaciale EXF-2481]KEQ90184.1 hypothetical protein AUEXF2481DRAFT_45330 [Aureobasidium subglaciale EXF-2481]